MKIVASGSHPAIANTIAGEINRDAAKLNKYPIPSKPPVNNPKHISRLGRAQVKSNNVITDRISFSVSGTSGTRIPKDKDIHILKL